MRKFFDIMRKFFDIITMIIGIVFFGGWFVTSVIFCIIDIVNAILN